MKHNEDNRDRIHSLVQRYERPLCQYAARITGDVDIARDVVQDTFLRLCRDGAGVADDVIVPWLYRVCRNRALDILRKGRPMKALNEEMEAGLASSDPGPAATVARQETLSHVARAMSQLPEPQEEAVRLKFQHDMNYQQIAQVMGITTTYVGYLIHTGIKTIRTELVRS